VVECRVTETFGQRRPRKRVRLGRTLPDLRGRIGEDRPGAPSYATDSTAGTASAPAGSSGGGSGGGPGTGGGVPASRSLEMVGTPNQVIVSPVGSRTLEEDLAWAFSLPQSIAPTSSPTFDDL